MKAMKLGRSNATEVPVRQRVIEEIRRIAAENGGAPPGKFLFHRMTGFSQALWQGQEWLKWNDAVKEAGFVPNARTPRKDNDELLAGYAAAMRKFGRVPTNGELVAYRKSGAQLASQHTYRTHFGGKSVLLRAVKSWAGANAEWADVAAMFASTESDGIEIVEDGGAVYLLKWGARYKIGCSRTPAQRTHIIARSLPGQAKLIHVIATDDPHGLEAYWHRRFAEKRKRAEWFCLTEEDVAAFRARRFQ